MELRQVLNETLSELMEKNENVLVIDADLAKANGTTSLRKKFPNRCLNVGVAEQNMASVAAGLSAYGYIPFISTFSSFATRRICDQIAISIAYAKQNVKIVGTDPGICAELNGGTHMGVEDIGTIRNINTMVIFEPADEIQLRQGIEFFADYYGPVYIRLFRKETPKIYGSDYKFDMNKADILRVGEDLTIATSGAVMVNEVLQAAESLKKQGVNAEVINVHTIKPFDAVTVLRSAAKTKHVLCVENHNVIGGLRSAVCEALTGKGNVQFDYIGIDSFGQVGRLGELKPAFNLTAENVINKSMSLLKKI